MTEKLIRNGFPTTATPYWDFHVQINVICKISRSNKRYLSRICLRKQSLAYTSTQGQVGMIGLQRNYSVSSNYRHVGSFLLFICFLGIKNNRFSTVQASSSDSQWSLGKPKLTSKSPNINQFLVGENILQSINQQVAEESHLTTFHYSSESVDPPFEPTPIVPISNTAESLSRTRLSFSLLFERIVSSTMFSPKQIHLLVKLAWFYFILYFFTVVYNVANKKVLESFPMPWTVAASQVFLGVPLILPAWAWKPPLQNFFTFLFSRSSSSEQLSLSYVSKIAACHGFGNVATVMALTSGSVSFVHVIKAAEPLFSAFLSVFILHSRLSMWGYLSLIPIVVGVAMASMKEATFSWWVFGTAMLSNLLYMSRMVLSKASIQQSSPTSGSSSPLPARLNKHSTSQSGTGSISAVNMFRLVTLVAALQLTPCALFFENKKAYLLWRYLQEHRPNEFYFVWTNLLLSGVSFYIYNEVAFWILDLVHPVTAAVGNSIKRIVLILASIIVFQTQVSELGWLGSALAIGGSFAYALSQQWGQGQSTSVSSSISSLSTNENISSSTDKLNP